MKRERRRYVAFLVSCDGELEKWKLAAAIENAIQALLGANDIRAAKHFLVRYNRETKLGILKVNHKFAKQAISALMSISNVDSKPVAVNTLKTSGTLRSIKRALPALL